MPPPLSHGWSNQSSHHWISAGCDKGPRVRLLTFFDTVIVINNAWKIISNWNELIFPYDFPDNKKPKSMGKHQRFVTEKEFVPAQESLGGFVYAGATMTFTAGYWALVEHKPSLMCFLGCNMVYPSNTQTHFYGSGRKDPLRDDISLTSLISVLAQTVSYCEDEKLSILNRSLKGQISTYPN